MGPAVHLQWFAEEGAPGNPAEGSGEGAKPAASFATDLFDKNPDGSGWQQASPKPAQEKPAGKPAEKAKEGQEKPTPALPGWTNATTKELRADPRFMAYASKFKSFDEAVKSAMELESKIGGMVSLPEGDSIPDKPEGYELKKRDDIEYSEDDVAEFKKLAAELKLSKKQAERLFDITNEHAAKMLKDYGEKQKADDEAAIQFCQTTLQKEWGEATDGNLAIVQRGMRAYANKDLMADAAKTGMGNSPAFIRLFYELGKMTREDSSAKREPGGAAPVKDPASIMYPDKK